MAKGMTMHFDLLESMTEEPAMLATDNRPGALGVNRQGLHRSTQGVAP